MVRFLRLTTLVLLVGTGVLAYASWKARRAPPLDEFGRLGAFSFTSNAGQTVSDTGSEGNVRVFACFFTCCTEFCPQLSGTMARLQHELKDVDGLQLLSLSVDPETDTPDKLSAYATAFGADPGRWLFLTGPRETVEAFVKEQLHLGVEENKSPDRTPGTKMLHSNKLTLVDRHGTIRGWFDGTDADEIDKLKIAVRKLAREQ